MWRQLLIVPLCCCLADDTEGISLRAQKYKSESADQASYYIDLFLGTPYQKVRAQLDTGSDLLAVPATRDSCAACSVPARLGGKVYNRAVSSTAAPLPCHSAECVHSRTEGLGNRTAVATVCPVKGRGGAYICPRTPQQVVFSGIVEPDAAGQCKLDPRACPILLLHPTLSG